MKQTEIVKLACQILRQRVRFEGASIRLPTTQFPDEDTEAIQDATRLYVETWIVPILDAIETGDTFDLRGRVGLDEGAKHGSFSAATERVIAAKE